MAQLAWGLSFSRTGGFPLDYDSIFDTEGALTTYLGTTKAYAGQIVAVTSGEAGSVYVIGESGSGLVAYKIPDLSQVTSLIGTAIAGLEGALQLVDSAPSTAFTAALTSHKKGMTFVVTTAGTYVGNVCELGDTIICKATGTVASDADWFVVQKNIDGAVTGPASSISGRIATFDGTTGKKIVDGGKTIAEVLAEAKNLANATGTLAIANGGTGQSTLAGAKSTLGVTALETRATALEGGTTPAGKATQLASGRYIDGVLFDGTGNVNHYSTCATTAVTAAKVVALAGFSLIAGANVSVLFAQTNSVAAPTLNVNSTGAKAIFYNGAALTAENAGVISAGNVIELVYDGTQYQVKGISPLPATVAPLVAGTAAIGTSEKYARQDHVHPLQTAVSGNAGTATKLTTARTITPVAPLSEGVAASFDGSANIATRIVSTTAIDFNTAIDSTVQGTYNTSHYFYGSAWAVNTVLTFTSSSTKTVIDTGGSVDIYKDHVFFGRIQMNSISTNASCVGEMRSSSGVTYTIIMDITTAGSISLIVYANAGDLASRPSTVFPYGHIINYLGEGFIYHCTDHRDYRLTDTEDWTYVEYA